MSAAPPGSGFTGLQRFPTHVPGLDTVLAGGLIVGDTYLVGGSPGTGKTTLGNQLAFEHATRGGKVLFATLLAESHDRMLSHVQGFGFFDPAQIGANIHYISLLGPLMDRDIEGTIRLLATTMREHGATLLVVDGTEAARMFTDTELDYAQFIRAVEARTAFLGCTTVLLAGDRESDAVATHVDGVIRLTNAAADARDARWLRVVKLRGSNYLNGVHRFAISERGIAVFPRVEATGATLPPAWHEPEDRLALGVPGLDAMLAGGIPEASSTLVMGTPGSGKTLLGLQFLAEGAARGERGLVATFHESPRALASTAERAGIDLARHIDAGVIEVMWRPPLELAPDEWAWQLHEAIAAHGPRRVVIDALSDLAPLFAIPERRAFFGPAIVNSLRAQGMTSLLLNEIPGGFGASLQMPAATLSASMDNAILLRTIEAGSSLRRIVSILKERQTAFDPTIREFVIAQGGIEVGAPFDPSGLWKGVEV